MFFFGEGSMPSIAVAVPPPLHDISPSPPQPPCSKTAKFPIAFGPPIIPQGSTTSEASWMAGLTSLLLQTSPPHVPSQVGQWVAVPCWLCPRGIGHGLDAL